MARQPHRLVLTDRHRRRPSVNADADLIDRARCGDRAAFGQLYQLSLDCVTRYVAVRMRDHDRDAVGDLVHDAYCFALAEPTLIGDDLEGSMLRLAARAVTRHQWSTRRYVRAAHTVYEDQYISAVGHSAPVTSAAVTRVTFAHALARLTPDQRRVIQLRLIDGYPSDAAAAAMGRTANAVRMLERRALRRLQQQFTTTSGIPERVADRLSAATGGLAR
jgi:RNA polymerase sigma-70 factor (ECF subfamily)